MARQIEPLNPEEVLIVCDDKTISQGYIMRFFKELPTRIVYTGEDPPPEWNVALRRQRIANVFKTAQRHLRPGMVLTVEDDTNFTVDDFNRIQKLYESRETIGFVSGVQAGRWGVKMIGAWNVNDLDSPTEFSTVQYSRIGTEQIDAAGFYFFYTSSDTFKLPDLRTGDFGPDVYFGLDLRRLGFYNLIDWDSKVGHATKTGELVVDKSCVVIQFRKTNSKLVHSIQSNAA